MCGLSTNLRFFIENQDALVSRYGGRVLLIRDAQVVGDYDSALQAYAEGAARFELGTFSIQRCEPGPQAYTVHLTPSQLLAG